MTSYYREFVRDFAHVAAPHHQLTSHQTEFRCDFEAGKAFVTLEKAMTKPPVPALPDMSRSLVVYTDASKYGVGAELTQKDDEGRKQPTQFASQTLQVARMDTTLSNRKRLR